MTSRNTNPHVSTSTGVNHSTSVSRPLLKSYQVKDKVVPNNSQVKFTKKEVEDHHRISSISKKTKSVTACNDSSNSRTLNVNAVCVECGKCVFNSNHDACVSKYLNDVMLRNYEAKESYSTLARARLTVNPRMVSIVDIPNIHDGKTNSGFKCRNQCQNGFTKDELRKMTFLNNAAKACSSSNDLLIINVQNSDQTTAMNSQVQSRF
ncbi:hypothetical protein Tco_1081243 [Tanacetum coccineum]|uniref:Uncharacterized protein n=1 Tax=Tanacetum coccineum TaxID=301880 RepID=A0ABQ5HX28_9ASTR